MERAFEVGAEGFMLKSAVLKNIRQIILTVYNGSQYISHELTEQFAHLPQDSTKQPVQTRLSCLTKREREILRFVSLGMSARQISQSLNISTWTVINHKANIMNKLGIRNQVGLARFAFATGVVG